MKPTQSFADTRVAIHLSIHDAVVINSQLMNAKNYLTNAIDEAKRNGWETMAGSWTEQLADLIEATEHYRVQIDHPKFVRVDDPDPEDHDPTR